MLLHGVGVECEFNAGHFCYQRSFSPIAVRSLPFFFCFYFLVNAVERSKGFFPPTVRSLASFFLFRIPRKTPWNNRENLEFHSYYEYEY